jgi:hypothetical protein
MQAQAAPNAFGAGFWREDFKDSLFQIEFILNQALKQPRTPSGLLKSFPARNDLVASPSG